MDAGLLRFITRNWPTSRRRRQLRGLIGGFLARYAKHNANFVLVVSGGFKAQGIKKVVEVVYDLLIKAIELRSLVLVEFGICRVGLK